MFKDDEDLFIWDNYNIDHIARHGVIEVLLDQQMKVVV